MLSSKVRLACCAVVRRVAPAAPLHAHFTPVAVVICATRAASWQNDLRARILRERARATSAAAPTTEAVCEPEAHELDTAQSSQAFEVQASRGSTDAAEPADDAAEEETAARDGTDGQMEAIDSPPLVESHADAMDIYQQRRTVVELLRAKRTDRREKRARFLVWQASLREKGYEQRTRLSLKRQVGRRRLHASQVASRYIGLGDAPVAFADDVTAQERQQRRHLEASGSASHSAAPARIDGGGDGSADFDDDLAVLRRNESWGRGAPRLADRHVTSKSLYGMLQQRGS
jgi:hypothetical protein